MEQLTAVLILLGNPLILDAFYFLFRKQRQLDSMKKLSDDNIKKHFGLWSHKKGGFNMYFFFGTSFPLW